MAVPGHEQQQYHHQQVSGIKILRQQISQKAADPAIAVLLTGVLPGRSGLLTGRRTTALPGAAAGVLRLRLMLPAGRSRFLLRGRTWRGRRWRGTFLRMRRRTAAVRHLAAPEAAIGLGDVSVIHTQSPSCQKLQTSGIEKRGGEPCHFRGPHGLFQFGDPLPAEIGPQRPQKVLLLFVNAALTRKA